ncbi:hypothetical protein R1sor_009856 [Riccia sorocarpa]|uniref:Uncharacterized protein n=1 Tax=Riccia sorocarpa TaxID=122646 RepID=A0ABD3I0A5_9MARC
MAFTAAKCIPLAVVSPGGNVVLSGKSDRLALGFISGSIHGKKLGVTKPGVSNVLYIAAFELIIIDLAFEVSH